MEALKCIDDGDCGWWTVGKVYDVNTDGSFYADDGTERYAEAALNKGIYDVRFEEVFRFIPNSNNTSDGSTASYYELPKDSLELQHLISAKNMNAQIGEIFRECYRYGQASHCDELRGIKKILFYAKAELERLEAINNAP